MIYLENNIASNEKVSRLMSHTSSHIIGIKRHYEYAKNVKHLLYIPFSDSLLMTQCQKLDQI